MTIMAQVFDTLNFANQLKAAGVDPRVAETHARLQAEIQADVQTKTLDEILKGQEEMEHTLASKADMMVVKADMTALKEDVMDLKEDVMAIKVDLLATKAELKTDMQAMRADLILKLGTMMAAGVAILGVLIKLQ